jgi:hypothetical protein
MKWPLLALTAIASLAGGLAASSYADQSSAPGQGRPERTLSCDNAREGGCDVSCMTPSGEPLFVYSTVASVFVTEFAARHTLLEIHRASPDEIISVLVGDISHCTFNGLRDPNLANRSLP